MLHDLLVWGAAVLLIVALVLLAACIGANDFASGYRANYHGHDGKGGHKRRTKE